MDPSFVSKIRQGIEPDAIVPAQGAEEKLVLPKGLADKIYATPGWFPVA